VFYEAAVREQNSFLSELAVLEAELERRQLMYLRLVDSGQTVPEVIDVRNFVQFCHRMSVCSHCAHLRLLCQDCKRDLKEADDRLRRLHQWAASARHSV
jgi:hypothetical protein